MGPHAWASGRITRVRVVTQADTTAATTDGLTRRLVPGSRTYHDLPTSPLVFDRGTGLPPPSAPHQPVPTSIDPACVLPPTAQVHQIGLLVDLELSGDEATRDVRQGRRERRQPDSNRT